MNGYAVPLACLAALAVILGCYLARTVIAVTLRLAVYGLTFRKVMPGRCPWRDPYELSGFDRGEFGGIAARLEWRGEYADEPQGRSQ